MRVACCVVLLFAGTLSAHAQAIRDRIKATALGISKTTRFETIADRNVAANPIPPKLGLTTTPPLRSTMGQFTLGPFRISKAQLETVSWSEISGWTDDDHSAAFETFVSSCKPIVRGTPLRRVGQPFYAALQSVCHRALIARPYDASVARVFFEQNFRPMRIARLGESKGLLTGYHEPIIVGSRVANSKFNVPVYRKPPDLARRDAGAYHDRTAIEEGALAGRNLEIVWLEDPTDLLIAEMEGSARIKLEDGSVVRLNYDGNNGWPYKSIEQILIERKVMPKDKMSVSRIRDWMRANPEEAKELRRRNKSFAFFRETALAEHEEPIGAQGVSLTPGRSIAVDRFAHVYGTPFFIEAELPIQSKSPTKFQRLMVSQDTGGAILGPARADLYFGAGDGPAHVAGRIRHPGQFTILIPREIDPVIAGAYTPLPRARPQFTKIEKQLEQRKEANSGVSLHRRKDAQVEQIATRQERRTCSMVDRYC